MLGRISLILLTFAIIIFAYFKWFERKGIYYPTAELVCTPIDVGLDYEDISLETKGGWLHAWFIPSEHARGTLLFCHGNAGNISQRVDISKIFHKLNLNVFIFDYRGYGKSQGRPSEHGLYQDARAAYQYLLNREDIDKNSIIIYGKSIGANVAIDLASKVSASALISESGFTSACDMGRELFPYFPVKWMLSIKFDAQTKASKILYPKLFIHSKNDEIVPFKMGQALFEAAAVPKEFYIMQGSHNDAVFMAQAEYTSRINRFLNDFLEVKH